MSKANETVIGYFRDGICNIKLVEHIQATRHEFKQKGYSDFWRIEATSDRFQQTFVYRIYHFMDGSYMISCFGLIFPISAYQVKYIIELGGKKIEEYELQKTSL